MGSGHNNYIIISKLDHFLGPKKALEAPFWGSKEASKDKSYCQASFDNYEVVIRLNYRFWCQNGNSKLIFRGII
jgi:hypothetical protein